MRRFCAFVAVLILVAGCNRQKPFDRETTLANRGTRTARPADPATPNFDVEVVLSQRAKKTLAESQESVIVVGWVTGNPKKGANRKYIDEMGALELADFRSELMGNLTAKIDFKIPKDRMEQTDGKDYELLINAFSGRKSSPDNLLDCGLYQGDLAAVQDQVIQLKCKLIGE